MRLYVYVLEGGGLPVDNLYVKLYLGKHKSKTRVVKNCKNPVWNEEFVFRVQNTQEDQLGVSVFHHEDESGFFSGSAELVGRVKIPISSLLAQENHTLPPTWFSLDNSKSRKFVNIKDCGKILLTLSLHGTGHDMSDQLHDSYSSVKLGEAKEEEDRNVLLQNDLGAHPPHRKQADAKHIVKSLANRLEKLFSKNEEAPKSDDSSDKSTVNTLSDYEDSMDSSPNYSFEEAIATFQSKIVEQKMIESLSGGVLIDQRYVVASNDLNTFLFAPNSQFKKDLAELQGTTDMQEEPWTWKSGDVLARTVTYTKAATKLVKAVKAIEDQKYIMAKGNEFAVIVSVSTPDVPYGNTFKVELLYQIMAGPELSSGEPSSHLVVSWGVNFIQNTMMKGMIEGGIKQGLKESFDQFAEKLAQSFKVAESKCLSEKDQMLATLQTDQQSDWGLAIKYFCNFTVISAAIMLFYVLVHIFYSRRNFRGLEFKGLDLPDSLGELITSGILVLQLERVYYMVSHFVQARLKRGSDQGVKVQGDGWVLTVALIEGVNLASLETAGLSDPYVVFTCNGKTRTSSVKLQTDNPQWNEILEFDAMEEPPSMLDVEVFDFDGPFDPADSLGHAEVNFLKQSPSELADMWVSLEGKLAQSSQSKLHLRMFLENNNGLETIKEHLTKMEKEVGKKLNVRSPYRSSTFQKLFHLPPDEYLISDFSCSLRRKLPLQGRLYLSARIVGFYANLFGHKTNFFYLWEDIEDIQVLPPSLSSVGSPTLVIVLKKGRGVDVRHGAKVQDNEGRLRFYFQSFVSFNVASRTVMALWRTRTLTPEQRAQIADEQQDADEQSVLFEDSCYGSNDEVLNMSKVYAAELCVDMKALMTMFDGEDLEYRVMGKLGCLNYVTTNWDPIKPDLFERRLFYKFGRHVNIYGGEVSSTQQKSRFVGREGWIINEVMVFHNVPFDDHFRLHFKYQIEQSEVRDDVCKCEAYMGIRWLKSTKFQHMISRNVTDKFTNRLQEIFALAEREILLGTHNTMPDSLS